MVLLGSPVVNGWSNITPNKGPLTQEQWEAFLRRLGLIK